MRRDSARSLQRRRRVYVYVTGADNAEIFCGKVKLKVVPKRQGKLFRPVTKRDPVQFRQGLLRVI